MLVGKELWEYLEARGVTRHKHENGLMSCWQCCRIVTTGKTKQQLEAEDNEWVGKLRKEIADSEPHRKD